MNKINIGDVYYLKSPLKSTVSKEHEKRISYLLGTVPSRPVVIFRPPVPWDTYGEVTVIPAIHNENEPGVKIVSYDRFGKLAESSYNFTVHSFHTVPVTRLGAYIGHLTDDEYKRIKDCVNWITNGMPMDKIPDDYKSVLFSKKFDNTDFIKRRESVSLIVDNEMNLYTSVNKDSNSCKKKLCELDIDIDSSISPEIAKHIKLDENFRTKPKIENLTMIKFPESIFTRDQLIQYASKYQYTEEIRLRKKPSVEILNKEERKHIQGSCPILLLNDVYSLYNKMTSTDVFLLGPWLPIRALMDMTNLNYLQTSSLKRLCNVMRDFSDNEIKNRSYLIKDDAEKDLNKLKPYLNETKISSIPQTLYPLLLSIPKYLLKKSYTGRKFDTKYKDIINKAKRSMDS